MTEKTPSFLDDVARYYSDKLAAHGETAKGVDWNGHESQTLRFRQLCQIISPDPESFSVNDLGCGYGALLDYLAQNYQRFSYCGMDVSADMIEAAERRHGDRRDCRFLNAAEPQVPADYGVASGIFNVRLDRTDAEWLNYLSGTLDLLDRTSRLGFAFNCLTSYSDEDRKRHDLYYADPCQLFDLCKRRYSRQVALLHDYELFEFTILVRKAP